jgi:polar amino acid transport system permease protein
VVVPQAVRLTLPPIGSNMIALLKESSLVSVIGIAELVNAAQLGISSTFRPFEFYIAVAAIYYLLNLLLEGVLALIERRVEATK